uniref:FXYD domain-containing ion transport regulator n=1 Tax=Acanthochromis polyacanthus TaxID=80966 RepID=A0A3Q1FLP8_9TELE
IDLSVFVTVSRWNVWRPDIPVWGLSFFIPDYESLRIGGLVFAVVLFLLGIALIPGNAPVQRLTSQGELSKNE